MVQVLIPAVSAKAAGCHRRFADTRSRNCQTPLFRRRHPANTAIRAPATVPISRAEVQAVKPPKPEPREYEHLLFPVAPDHDPVAPARMAVRELSHTKRDFSDSRAGRLEPSPDAT